MSFHPLGIALNPRSRTLYVVNHSPTGPSIEVLTLSADGRAATHTRTIENPSLQAPNSIAPLWESDTELLITNDHGWPYESSKILHTLESYLALPVASVVHFDLVTGEAKVLDHLPFANGVVALNATHVAVASTSMQAIHIYEMDPDAKALKLVQKLHPHFWTDNLKLDADGKLLCAGHPHPFELVNVAQNNQFYNLDGAKGNKTLKSEVERPRAPSWAVEWDGNPEGTLKDVYIGTEYGASTAASRDVKRKFGMISGLYEKGLLMYNM